MSIVGTLSALNGNLTSTLTDSDLLQPTLNGAYSDDYQLIDVIIGQSVTIELMSDDYDTYLQLINADTGFVITENDDYEDETLNSGLSFIAAEGINYIVRVSGYDETEIGIYQLSAISTDPVLTQPGDGYGGDGYGGDGYGGDGYGGDGEAPNLSVTNNIISPSQGYTDSTLDISWTVSNTGNTATDNTYWYDQVYLSTDETFDNEDSPLISDYVPNPTTPLAIGDSYSRAEYLDIPNVTAGNYYLLFYTDQTRRINESDETDNISAVPFEILQSDIDLSVDNINIPEKAKPGQRITINFDIVNNGSTPIEGRQWSEKLYLSQDEIIDSNDDVVTTLFIGYSTTIMPGEASSRSIDYYLPDTEIGDYYLIFSADHDARLQESDESNNITSMPIKIGLPNLTMSDTSSPSEAVVNDTVDVSWIVSNTGNDLTSAYYWYDQVFLSRDANYDEDDTQLVYKNSGQAYLNLEPNSSYTSNAEISLPNAEAGDYYLIFYTDKHYRNYDSEEIESNETDNFTAVPITLNAPDVDLSITNANAPPTALVHSEISVSWEITNNGTDIVNGGWYEGFYISDDEYLDENDTYADKAYNNEDKFIEPGSTRLLTFNVDVPNIKTGSRYLLFVADYDNRRSETNDNNNVYAVPIDITAPNLTVTSASAPVAVNKGSEISALWKVENTSNQYAWANSLYDHIYLSTDENYNEGDRFLRSFYRDNYYGVVPGRTYVPSGDHSFDREFTIPNETVPGNYYLLFYADSRDFQGETDETDNVTALPIEVFDTTNIEITDVDTPSSAILDDKITVSWIVSNTGLADASATWYDYIYLSEDEVYDSNDAYAGFYRYDADTIIKAGESFTATHEISISESLGTGERYLLFVADHTGILPENDETDNVYSVPISLDVTNLELTDADVFPSVSIYETFDLSWIVTNTGTGRASSYWNDEIYLSEDENYDNSDERIGYLYHNANTPLNSGASYEATETVNIPNSVWLGNQYVLFITDENDYQAESDEADNVLALPIEIKAANLVVTDVVHPQNITTSGAVSTSVTVSNVGDVNLANWSGFITNTVYLSDDEIFDVSDRDIGTTRTYITNTNTNEIYTANIDIKIPHDAKGSKYLIFSVDDDRDLIESNDDDNYYTVPIKISTPNLTLSDSVSPDWAGVGQTIPVSWTVTNNSEVPTVPWSYEDSNVYWDRIYLSSDPVWDNGDSLVDEKIIAREGTLAPGDSYTVSQEITLPNGQFGELYLLFVSDTNNRQGETDEADNVRAVPILITDNGVNLQVTNADAPTIAVLGQTIAVDWTTVNVGGVSASLDWLDHVYLSEDPTFDNTDYRLSELPTGSLSPLAPSSGYDIVKNVTIPLQGAGSRYLIFKADGEDDQIETDNNDNTYVLPLELLAPNLTAINPVAPNTAFLGESINLSWTIANIENVDALGNWQETVYISDDQYLDLDDQPFSYNNNSFHLAAGTKRTTDKNAEVPRTAIGDRYLLFVADSNNVQGETDETDNVVALPIKLTALDVDLVVSDIAAPLESFAGEEIEVVWTVTNNGSDDATGTWIDGIYLTLDPANIQANEIYGSFEFTGTVAAGQSIERRQKITLPQTLEGDFQLIVQTDVNDSLIEYGREDNNIRVREEQFTSILPAFANLQVTNVVAPSTAFSSQSTVVEWTVSNVGDAATSAPRWQDSVWLSLDQNFDSTDIKLEQTSNISYLNPGDSYTSSLEVDLPQGIEGNYYFFIQTDWSDRGVSQVFEFQNENDNLGISNISDIELTPPPDLQVSVNAPSNAFSGQLEAVSWTVTNEGLGRTLQSSWYDEVYLSTDTVLDSSDEYLGAQNHSGSLEPGESYTVNEFTRLFRLPEGISGDYYFIVRTDAGGQVFESALSTNNTGFDETVTQVFLTPPPDIEISLDAPSFALASHDITLYFSSGNFGATPVTRGSWSNNFYLSEDEQFDSSSDILLGSRTSYESYGTVTGSSYLDKSIVVTLPDGISGDYYIFAQADSDDAVFELDKKNNIAFDTITIDSQPADLILSKVTTTNIVEAGTAAKVSWTTVNQGSGDTVDTRWNDEIWLSADSIIGNGNDYLLETFSHNGSLQPGESYSNSELVIIPFNLQGDYQLYVKTDADDDVYEGDGEVNNISSLSSIAIARQTPDLQVNLVNAPVTGVSGESFFVEWTVINSGTGKTNSNYWYDEVFLSLDLQVNDKSDISLGKVYHSGTLEANETYKVGHTFELPQNLERDYYIVVKTDVDDQVLETPLENNNETASNTTTSISLNAVPDLVFDSIDAPIQGISGQTFELSWKVSNQGADTSSGWTDVFYLSQDQVLDRDNDIYLGSSFNKDGLAAGAEFAKIASFNISPGLSGPFYVFGVVDSGKGIYERDGEDNNIAFDGKSMNVILTAPADLTVGEVSVPSDGVPGQNITINYTVNNQGDFTVDGNWEDAIYLSEDEKWDINDPLIDKVRVFDLVDSAEGYSRTVNADLPGVAWGDYHVIVRSDIRNHVYELNDDNNLQVSVPQINIDPELLELDSSDTDTIRPGKSVYYRLEVTAGQAIRIKLDSQVDSSSNNVYVRHGQVPTKGQFDFFTEPFYADPELVFPIEQNGTYYVLVTGDDSSAASNFTITAEEIPFSLLDVSTKQVGNVAPFTLELEGAKFDADNTAFQIVDKSGTVFEATQVVLKDSTTAYATFDLSGQSTDNYDVRVVKNDGTSVVLEDILVVEEGVDAELYSAIDGPGLVRPGGKYFAKLNYANVGGADEAAPLIILQTPDTSLGLSADLIAPTESLFLLGVGEDLGADVLRAGEINKIPFFFAPGGSVNVSMLRYTEDSSNPITETDWNTIETAIKPVVVADEDWGEFWSTIQPRIGNTWGDYVQVVNDLAKAFSPEAERDYDVRELFAEWYESGDLSVYTPKSFVSGRLIDTETGEALSNVELQLYQEIDGKTIQNLKRIVTDSEGQFVVSHITSGAYKLAILGNYLFTESSSKTFIQSDKINILSAVSIESSDASFLSETSSQSNNESLVSTASFQSGDTKSPVINIDVSENNINSLDINVDSSPDEAPFDPSIYGTDYQNFYNELSNEINRIQESSNKSQDSSNNLPVPGGNPKPPARAIGRKLGFGIVDVELSAPRSEIKNCDEAKITQKYSAALSFLENFNDKIPFLGGTTPTSKISLSLKSSYETENNIYKPVENQLKLDGTVGFKIKDLDILALVESVLAVVNQPEIAAVVGLIRNGLESIKDAFGIDTLGSISVDGGIGGELNLSPDGRVYGDASLLVNYGGQISFSFRNLIDINVQVNTKNSISLADSLVKISPGIVIKGYVGDLDISIDESFEFETFPRPDQEKTEIPLGRQLFNLLAQWQNPGLPPGDCDDDEHNDDDNNGDLGDYNPAVLTSRDPNDILGPDGFGEEKWIDAEEPLEYTIRFENDPELATAPAQVVKITQQLDEDLDFRTFRLGDFGFGDTFIDVPDNRAFYQTRLDLVAEKGIYVDFFAGIDIATGEAFWELRSIDPATGEQPNDPLLGFLPPNLTKPEGDGFVNYSIRTDRDIETGAVIDAEARIIFDINEPIDTPPIFNTIDAVKPTSIIEALPSVSDTEEFTVSWTGNDDPKGSAIANYTIYVAENGGEFTPWLENTTLTEALFTGIPGSSYQFYAVATDNAGNIEDIPLTSQAQTTIAGGNNPPLLLNPLDDLIIAENSNFSFTISDNVFIDTDAGDVLNYSATLADGSPLPLWLDFDGANQIFTGTPVSEDVGILEIEITATDSSNEIATDLFTLEVQEVIEEPVFSTIGEFGKVSDFNHLRQTIEFNNNYDNPVVFALPLSRNGGDPATVRITNLESDGFTAYLQEPEYKDGWHVTEIFSYLVLEAGDWVLEDGTLLEVGTVNTHKLTTQGWENLDFDLDFESIPAILSQVQTKNGGQFVRTRQRGASVDGFLLSMEEEEALKYSGHLTETVGWLAIETGTGVLGELEYQAGHTDKLVNHQGYTIDFEAEFDSAPSLFASLASFYGGDSAGLRYQNLTNENVRIILEEEKSLDAETAHVDEIVDFIALSGTGDLLATAYVPNELS